MSEFTAKIKAILDTTEAEKQINNLGKNKKVYIKADANQLNKTVKQVDSNIRDTTKATRTFSNTLRRSFDIGTAATITAAGFNAVRTAARDAKDAITDFDGAITQLRMATGENYAETMKLVKGYNAFGKVLGATTTEMTDGADAWLRQGHSIKDTNTLIRDSMILSKVANLDSADSTKYLTSAMKSFGTAVEDVIGIVDRLTAVDIVSATDAGGLAEAMSRTAVTAKQAGVSMDELIGYLATVGEVTQKSMTSVGESFKTIFTRMADIKAGKLQLVDEDGTVELLSDVETVLSNLGIKLRDSNNEFRDSSIVLRETAAVWNELGTVQQAAISKAFAGTRQAENFRVLMENFHLVEKYVDVSANSMGAAEKKFSAYLDSIEAKTKSLQASFESLAFNTISTGSVGSIIDATTALITFLDQTNLVKGALAGGIVAGSVKMFSVLAAAITHAAVKMNALAQSISILKSGNIGQEQIQQLAYATSSLSNAQLKTVLSSSALTTQQRIAILTAQGMSKAEAQAALAAMGLATAEGTATAATVSFSGVLKGLWATLKANPLILVASAVTAAVSVYSTLKQKTEEAREASLEAGRAAKEEADKIRDLYSAYSEAKSAYDGTDSSKQTLKSTSEELLTSLGLERSEIEKLTEDYDGLSKKIDEITTDAIQSKLTELTAGYSAAQKTLLEKAEDGVFTSFGLLNFQHGDNGKVFADTLRDAGLISSSSYGSAGGAIYLGDNSTVEGTLALYQKLLDMRDELNAGVTKGFYTRDELVASELFTGINAKITQIEKESKDVLDYIDQINEATAMLDYIAITSDTGIPETQAEFDALKQSMIDAALAGGNYVGTQEDMTDAVTNFLNSIPAFSKFFTDITEEIVPPEIKKLSFADLIADTDSDNDFIDQVTSYREAAEDLQGALEKLRAGEEVDLPSLYEQFPELAGAEDLEQAIVELLGNKATELGGIFDTYYESLDTSVEGSIPAFDAYREAVLALFNTAEEGTPIFASLADAMEGVGNASSLIENIQKEMAETGSLSFDTLQSIVKQFGSSAGEYFTISDGKITADIEKIKLYYTQAIKDMGLESKELETALIDALNGGFDEAEFGFNALSDAMSKAQSVAAVAAAAQKDMTYDQVETMRSLLGEDFEKYIIKDEAGNFKAADVAGLREYARELLVTEGASSSLLAEFDSMWETTIAGSKEAETALDRVTKAISNVKGVSDYLTMLQSDDITFIEALTAATKLLEDMPDEYSLENFFTFGEDGSIEYHTEFLSNWIGKHIDEMVAAGDVSQSFADKLKEAAQAESTLISYTEKMSEAMTKVQKASDVVSTARKEMAEDGAISLGTLQDLYKEFGENAGDYFTIDSGVITADIEKIKEHYVQLIRDMKLESPELEQALIDALDAGFDESQFDFDALSDAMSKAQQVASVAAESQEKLTYDSIESLRELFGADFEKYINKDAAGNYLSVNTEALKEYARGLLVAENATEGTLAQFDAMWENTIAGSTETTTALERVTKALNNVGSVSDYLTLLESDDLSFMDALSSAVKLLEEMGDGYSLEDFFTFGEDGSIEYHTEFLTTWLEQYIDKMVKAGDITEETGEQMKKAAKAEAEHVDKLEKLTDAMSDVSKAANLMKKAQEEAAESGSNSLDTILSLYEQFGEKANNMLTQTADGDLVINTEAIRQEMYGVIDTLDEVSPEIKQKMKDALNVELDEKTFEEQVDVHVEKVKSLQDALANLRDNGLSDSDIYDLTKEFPELTTKTGNLEEAIIDLLNSMNADVVGLFAKQFGKVDSAEDRKELQAFMDIVLKLGEVVGNTKFAIDIAAETEGMQHLFDAIKESVSSTGLSAEAIDNLYARYEKLDAFNPAKLFEKTENGIHLNTTALRKLESEYEKFTKQNLDDNLNNLVEEYNSLTEQIDAARIAAGTTNLYARRNDILNQINETSELAAQYAGLTSAFYKWEQAQSMGEEGDMYDSLAGGLENIKELYDQGLVGTNKFRTAVQLMTDQDMSTASIDALIAAYEKGYPKMQRYFQDSSDGVSNFLHDVQNLNSEWATLNKDGSWDINFGVGNDEEIAKALGINVEAVQSIMRKLSDYGFDINLDSEWTDLDIITTKAEKAAQSLQSIGKTDYSFNVNATNLERINEQIVEAQWIYDSFEKGKDGTIQLGVEGAEEAKYLLASLIMQRQSLDEPTILKIDTTNVSGEIGETLRKLDEIWKKRNELEIQTNLGADTTQLQAELDAAIADLGTAHADILASLGIDTESQEKFVATVSSIEPEVMVKYGVDTAQVTEFQEANHDAGGTVTYNVDDTSVQRYQPNRKYAYAYYTAYMYSWTPPTKYGTVYYTAQMGGTAHVDGTAYAHGTAYARGDWGTKNSGYALGGELGQELVVRDGKFFTIGDESAEFFQYKKGDIIFNAAQTEEIFEKGKITNAAPRGKAFSSGSGKITGGGSTTTTSSGGGSSSSSSNYDEEDKPEEPKIFDWIEVALDRIQRVIEKFATTASSTFHTLRKRLTATSNEIASVNKELILQEKAHARYLEEAESVGLPENIAALVREGTIDISEYDAETAELIEQYQEWYEKALDCADAIEELKETLASLYQERFDAIATDFDNQLDQIEHRITTLGNTFEIKEAKGFLGGASIYSSMREAEMQKLAKNQQKYIDLQRALNLAVASGNIEVGSEAWYEMQAAINETKEAIQESNLAIIEYDNSIRELDWSHFDYLQSRISQITGETEFLIGLLENDKLYNENGQFSDAGVATVGMHGINYNTYLAQADKYADELRKIQEDLEDDPYDTALIERREELLNLQRESISAAEDEKQAIVDMVEEGINLELDSMNELIETYKESLNSAKSLYDYQKKISGQTSEIASLQKQLSAYSGDTSEENRARLQKLQVSLTEAQDKLEESQYDQYIKDQTELLDDLYADYETVLNERLDNVDALIADMIEATNANADTIADTIIQAGNDVGYTLTNGLSNILSGDGTMLAEYSSQFSSQLTTLNTTVNAIESYVAAMIGEGDHSVQTDSGSVVGFSSGGYVAELQKIAMRNGDDMITVNTLKAGEAVLTEGQLGALSAVVNQAEWLNRGMDANGMLGSVWKSPIADSNYGTKIENVSFDMPIYIDHVEDYNDFVTQLRDDPKFEKMVQAMTTDLLSGNGRQAKYKFQWK